MGPVPVLSESLESRRVSPKRSAKRRRPAPRRRGYMQKMGTQIGFKLVH